MTSRDCFMKAICETPEDDVPRLVFADWLDEHDEPERAEFIRVQCERAKTPDRAACDRCRKEWVRVRKSSYPVPMSYCPQCHTDGPFWPDVEASLWLRQRERDLLAAHELDWLAGWPLWDVGFQANSTWVPEAEWEFRRGFVESITCSAEDFLAHEAALTWCRGKCQECTRAGATPGEVLTQDAPGRDGIPRRSLKRCPSCSGSGRVPKPYSPTAQPIREVHLTTVPDWEHAGEWEGAIYPNDSGHAFDCPRWPGITFHLPR